MSRRTGFMYSTYFDFSTWSIMLLLKPMLPVGGPRKFPGATLMFDIPILANCSLIAFSRPVPRSINVTTAAIPITMPRTVNKLLSLRSLRLFTARVTMSFIFKRLHRAKPCCSISREKTREHANNYCKRHAKYYNPWMYANFYQLKPKTACNQLD